MSLSDDLNMLIGHYGLAAVHSTLQTRIKEEYEYLKKLFEKKSDVEEKPIKEKKVEPVVVKNEVVKTEVVETVENEVVETVEAEKTEEPKKFKDSKEQKIWQREMEEKKKKENLEKGISIKSLLTKENLKKWIEEEGRTYSYIAREYTGCKDTEVSAAAKLFGIESTRKNVLIKNSKK
jgi:hypothetical protein